MVVHNIDFVIMTDSPEGAQYLWTVKIKDVNKNKIRKNVIYLSSFRSLLNHHQDWTKIIELLNL